MVILHYTWQWRGVMPPSLNQTTGDWHSDAHADRSRVVTSLEQSARSCCAETYDSGDSPGGASPHAGRSTRRPVGVPVSAPSAAPVRRRPDAERSSQRAFLFALQRGSDRPGIPGRHAHLRGGQRARHAAKTAAATYSVAPTLGPRAAQNHPPRVRLGSDAVELCHVSGRAPSAPKD
jgi:hypothetical protein